MNQPIINDKFQKENSTQLAQSNKKYNNNLLKENKYNFQNTQTEYNIDKECIDGKINQNELKSDYALQRNDDIHSEQFEQKNQINRQQTNYKIRGASSQYEIINPSEVSKFEGSQVFEIQQQQDLSKIYDEKKHLQGNKLFDVSLFHNVIQQTDDNLQNDDDAKNQEDEKAGVSIQPYEVKILRPKDPKKKESLNIFNSPSLQNNPSSYSSGYYPQTLPSINNNEIEVPQIYSTKQTSEKNEKQGGKHEFFKVFRMYKERNMQKKVVSAFNETKENQKDEKNMNQLKKKALNFWMKLKSYVYISGLYNQVQYEKSQNNNQVEENYLQMINDISSNINEGQAKDSQQLLFHTNQVDREKNLSFTKIARRKIRVFQPHELTSLIFDLWTQFLIIKNYFFHSSSIQNFKEYTNKVSQQQLLQHNLMIN